MSKEVGRECLNVSRKFIGGPLRQTGACNVNKRIERAVRCVATLSE